MYADVFWALQWCQEVKVEYIDRHKPGSFYRDDAVEEDFDDEHIYRGCGYFTWVVYFLSAYGESSSVFYFFLWLYTAHKLPICYIFYLIVWYFFSGYEHDFLAGFLCVFRPELLAVRICLLRMC